MINTDAFDPMSKHFKFSFIAEATDIALPMHISTLGFTEREWNVNWGALDKVFIVCSAKGCGKAFINNEWVAMPEGSVLYLPPKTPIIYQPMDDAPWSTAYITFYGKNAESLVSAEPFVIRNPRLDFICNQILELKKLRNDENLYAVCHSLLYYILLMLRSCIDISNKQEEGFDSSTPIAQKVFWSIKKLSEKYTEDVPLSELAVSCGISQQYYCRLFKDFTNTTPTKYINSLRIERACDLLKSDSDLKIADIGTLCGFENTAYFNKIFKRYIGITPTEYRNSFNK